MHGSNITQIYSDEMKKTLEMQSPSIQDQDEYIIVSSGEEKVYLDTNGNKIEDISSIKETIFPDKIGEYKRRQITIDNIYYSK